MSQKQKKESRTAFISPLATTTPTGRFNLLREWAIAHSNYCLWNQFFQIAAKNLNPRCIKEP